MWLCSSQDLELEAVTCKQHEEDQNGKMREESRQGRDVLRVLHESALTKVCMPIDVAESFELFLSSQAQVSRILRDAFLVL